VTTAQRLLYAYLSKLATFFCFMPALLVPYFLFEPDLPFYTMLYLLPFTAIFIIKWADFSVRKTILLVIATPLVFGGIAFLLFPLDHSITIWVCLLFLTLVVATSNTSEYGRNTFISALMLNILPALFFIFSTGRLADFVLPTLLAHVAIIVIASALCRFYRGLDGATRSRSFRHQSKDAAQRFLRRSHRLFFGFFGLGMVFVLIYAIWGFDVNINPEFDAAVEQRFAELDIHLDTMVGIEDLPQEIEVVDFRDPEDIEEVPMEFYDYYFIVQFLLVILALLASIILARFIRGHRVKIAHASTDEEIEEETIAASPRYRRKGAETLSTNRQVRRAFKRKVNTHRRRGLFVKQADTPRRISDKINPTEDIGTLTTLYHQARYSNQKIPQSSLVALKRKK